MTGVMTGVETLEALIAAMRGGDLDGAAALIHRDVVVSEPASLPYGGVHRGRNAFVEDVLGGIMKRASLEIAEATVRDAGDVVVVQMVLKLTAHATGRTATVPIIELYTVRDGLVTNIDVYPKDTVAYLEVYAP
jgi:ketosteroid isomerase-like protein